MHNSAPIPWFVIFLLVIFGIMWIAWIVLALTNPRKWVEWFLDRPYRWWGLRVIIEDEARFKNAIRFYTAIPCVVATIGLLVAYLVSNQPGLPK